jgi:hypothetical protein
MTMSFLLSCANGRNIRDYEVFISGIGQPTMPRILMRIIEALPDSGGIVIQERPHCDNPIRALQKFDY